MVDDDGVGGNWIGVILESRSGSQMSEKMVDVDFHAILSVVASRQQYWMLRLNSVDTLHLRRWSYVTQQCCRFQ
jgi:hypothetical protein